jgi:hypothetical protein
MNMKAVFAAAAVALTTSVTAASAVSVDINITRFGTDATGLANAHTAWSDFLVGDMVAFESFEGEGLAGTPNPLTSVGQFTGTGSTGGGQSAFDCGGGVGATSCVRSDDDPSGVPGPFGRFALDGENWLDSNDMTSVLWEIPGGATIGMFSHIAFFLTDLDDVGSLRFFITVNGDIVEQRPGGNNNLGTDGTLHLVTMKFSSLVGGATILMTNGVGDGFGIDKIGVSAVPLPAAGWMLLAGVGGLLAAKRRKKA